MIAEATKDAEKPKVLLKRDANLGSLKIRHGCFFNRVKNLHDSFPMVRSIRNPKNKTALSRPIDQVTLSIKKTKYLIAVETNAESRLRFLTR
jgi:hypothetical protein